MSGFRALLLCLVALCPPAFAARRPRIWFFPNDPPRGVVDYMRMFEPGAPWQKAASHVEVFGIYPQLLWKESDEDLAKMFRWLNERRIPLAFEYGMLHPHHCGGGIEGYSGDNAAMARRIKRLGGNLRYLVADEPIAHGHYYRGPRQCADSISAIARDAASAAKEYESVFPDVQFILSEALPAKATPALLNLYLKELGQFLAEFKRDSGRPFMGVQLDVVWTSKSGVNAAREYVRYLRRIHVPVGAVYGGDRSATSDRQWLAQASNRYRGFERMIGSPPDFAFLMSWHPRPTHMLPETSPGAFTSIILQYSKFSARAP